MSRIPKLVFIVPYRNRPEHKFFFSNYLNIIMNNRDDYDVYFSHQCDSRSFNRGGTKNIGFLAVKQKYPNDYKDITFIFNDIDTIPFSNIFDYETKVGTLKHFYGFNYALGGIVSIKGSDFESLNGFPNFWGWGMEDNVLQKRCEKKGLIIDRSHFFPIGNQNIIQLFDGITRIINKKDPWRAKNDSGIDGLMTIHNLEFTIDYESNNPLDNIHVVSADNIYIVNITKFMTSTTFEKGSYYKYDLREPSKNFIRPDKVVTNNAEHINRDWSNIPFYPTPDIKNEMIKKYGEKRALEIIEYNYKKSTNPTTIQQYPNMTPPFPPSTPPSTSPLNNIILTQYQEQLIKIQKYNEAMMIAKSNQRIVPPNINKYSPEYSRLISAKPKASVSANIRLGGVYR